MRTIGTWTRGGPPAQEAEPDQEPPAPLREAVQPQRHDRARLALGIRRIRADGVDEGTRDGKPEGDGRDGKEQAHRPGHGRADREGDDTTAGCIRMAPR